MPRFRNQALAAVVALAGLDVRTMQAGDVLNVVDQVRALAPREALFLRPTSSGHPDPEVARDWLLALQGAVQRLLRQLAQVRQGRRETVEFRGLVALHATPPYRALHLTLEPGGRDHRARFIAAVILEVLNRLARIDLALLRQCVECRRWFVAPQVDRIYDTSACGNRLRWRRFQKRQRAKSKK